MLYPDRGPEPTRLLLLPERIGLPVDAPTLEFPVTDEDRTELADALSGEPPAEYACIAPERGARGGAGLPPASPPWRMIWWSAASPWC